MKCVILIHSNPHPWGHPTIEHTPEGCALGAERRKEMDRDFDELLEELSAAGELGTAEALGDPASAPVYRWRDDRPFATDGAVRGDQGAPRRVLPHRLRLA